VLCVCECGCGGCVIVFGLSECECMCLGCVCRGVFLCVLMCGRVFFGGVCVEVCS
jgi:hypothetical protein